jgi:hypothetical protein
VTTAREIMLATIISSAPEILERNLKDGSTFRASGSFVRKWLHDALNWSRRKRTQAAHRLSNDWEDQCGRSFLRKERKRISRHIIGQFRPDTSCIRTWRQDDMSRDWFKAGCDPWWRGEAGIHPPLVCCKRWGGFADAGYLQWKDPAL